MARHPPRPPPGGGDPSGFDGVARAFAYARDVLAGLIPACRLVHLACERFHRDMAAAEGGESPWEFRPARAEAKIALAEMLPHIKGPLAGQPMSLSDWQCFAYANLFGFYERGTDARRFRQGFVFVPRGNGKGLAVDEEVATPNGFTRMADIKAGDLVFDRDGTPCVVAYASPIRADLACFEVAFDTGELIICDEQHLWLTQDTKERDNARYRLKPRRKAEYSGPYGRHFVDQWRAGLESAKPIRQIAATLEYGAPHPRHGTVQKNHRVRLAAPLQTPAATLPLDPYVLGYWLGDGTSAKPEITVGLHDETAFLAQMDRSGASPRRVTYPSAKGRAATYRFGDGRRGNKISEAKGRLRDLDVLNNKHIPRPYLRASEEQRWRLLQGLMDSDGSAATSGQCEFAFKLAQLAHDARELAASLGLRPGPVRASPAILHGRAAGMRYRVSFHAYADQPVFAFARKQARLKPRPKQGGYQRNRIIVGVRPVPSVATRCIQVDSPSSTFLVGRTLIPTHNTTLAAPAALGMTFCEGEGGAEGFAAAVTRDQARILFDVCKEMVRRSPRFQQTFGVRTSKDAIYQEASASNFVPISSDAKALDGKNVHVAVLDEIGSHRTPEVYDVMLTGMGKRTHPMMLAISTATGNTAGIGKQQWDYCVRVLQGKDTDERLFALIYTVDDGDDVWDEATWIKANPNWGVSVQPDAVRAIMRQARSNPAREAAVMTRHLNVWVGADEALFSMRAWRARAEPALRPEDFEGQEAHIALDLASKVDLASCAVTFPARTDDGNLSYVTFSQSFLNEQAVLEARHASYPGWAAEGCLHVTQGNETDFSAIEDWLLDCCRRFRVLSVAYDPWAATQFAQRMMAQDVPMVEFRATTQNFSEPTKELDAAIHGGRIRHEGDPVLEWAIGNVVGRYDARANVYPRKSREQNKIDPAIALIMTIGRCMAGAETESSYNDPARRSSIWLPGG